MTRAGYWPRPICCARHKSRHWRYGAPSRRVTVTERKLWIDHAKGIGIILVVYGHVARGIHGAGLTLDEDAFHIVDSVIYSFHMPLFFFLSGLHFPDSLRRQGRWRLIAGKIDAIVYPYIVWSLIQGAVEVMLSRFTNGHVSVLDIATLLWHPRAHFWFLYALFFTFLAATLVYRKLDPRWCLLVVVGSLLVGALRDGIPGGVPFNFLYQYFVFFALGVVTAPVMPRLSGRTGLFSLLAVLALATCQFAIHGPLGLDLATQSRVPEIGVAVLSIGVILVLSQMLEHPRFTVLARIGRASMGVYLMHIIAGSGARIVLHKALGIDSAAVHLVVGTLAGIALPLVAMQAMHRYGLPGFITPPPAFSLSSLVGRQCAAS